MTSEQAAKLNLFAKHADNLSCRCCHYYLSAEQVQKSRCYCGQKVSDEQKVSWVICCELCQRFADLWQSLVSGYNASLSKHEWRTSYVSIQGGVGPWEK